MKINPMKLEIAIANSGLTMKEIQRQGRLSNITITRARNAPEKLNLFTVGKLARALGVDVEELVEEGK